jgi:hypothetical protein
MQSKNRFGVRRLRIFARAVCGDAWVDRDFSGGRTNDTRAEPLDLLQPIDKYVLKDTQEGKLAGDVETGAGTAMGQESLPQFNGCLQM